MLSYEQIRRQHNELLTRMIPEHLERLNWSRQQIDEERLARLRETIRIAKDRSPWHAKRLTHINPSTITEAEIEAIPPMTRNDLMSNWNEIVTDRRLTLELVELHLASNDHHAYLLDEYTACASGGSSGRRGVFVYNLWAWATAYMAGLRHRIRKQMESEAEVSVSNRLAYLGSHHPAHMAYAFHQIFGFPGFDSILLLGVKDPIEEVVRRLNEFQPTQLIGYPTALQLLAREQKEGRLSISPKNIASSSEPLFTDIREALTEAWGLPVLNIWAMSEMGACGHGIGQETSLMLNDDLSIIEAVDSKGRYVPPGVRSAKIFITNLFNHALPLIRLEVTDEITLLEAGDQRGSGHRMIEEVEGRRDEIFIYEGMHFVHPHIFRSILGRERSIVEYQVRQTRNGAEILIVTTAQFGNPELECKIAEALASIGIESPVIVIHRIDRIERLATGKLKRFIPLSI
jgi:phenylacetate-CoA ligase